MSTVFHHYVEKVVQQIDGNQADKADIYEELIIHLQLSSEQFMQAGYDKKEAEQMAIENFGKSEDIGDQMQQSMFPFRKKLFLVVAIASLIYSFTAYLIQLFVEGDAHIGWLIVSVVTSSILLLFALQAFPAYDRKAWLNSTLILHIFVYLYGFLLSLYVNRIISLSLAIFAWIIILLSIILVYRTTIYDYQFKQIETSRQTKIVHAFNITIGIIAIGVTLFLLWAILLFAESFELRFFIFLIPLIVWVIAYVLQIKLIARNKKKSAYLVGAMLLIFFLLSIVSFFVPLGGIR